MDEVLVRFGALLSARGVRVSPAESLDALGALRAVGVRERDEVREALRATMVKNSRDELIFEELFDAFFAGFRPSPASEDGAAEQTGASVTVQDVAPDDVGRSAPDLLETGDRQPGEKLDKGDEDDGISLARASDRISLAESEEPTADDDARQTLHFSRMSTPADPGEIALSEGEEIDADASALASGALPGEEPTDPDELAELRRSVQATIDNLPELLARHLAALERSGEAREVVDPRSRYRMPFSEDERRRMDELLRRLGRELRGARSHQHRVAARGRLHASRTVRHNMRYGGMPFAPIKAGKREDRPRLVLLVDVSMSVRNTARFTLHLVAGLQSLFAQVRTFAYVRDLAEVSSHLQSTELDEALGMIFGGDVLDVDANTDFGRALEQFSSSYMSTVSRTTTVLILGDGRNNRKDPNLAVVSEIARRARQVVWLTPEAERYWHLGVSDMKRYAELCDRVELVRDLDGLEAVAGDILRRV